MFLAQESESDAFHSFFNSWALPYPRKDPFVVRGVRQKVLVSATLENRKENAYNTSLSLSFSRNLHLASFMPQVPGAEEVWEESGREEKGDWGIDLGCEGLQRKAQCLKAASRRAPAASALAPPPLLCSQRDSPVKVECTTPSPHVRLCSVGHPVFRTGAKVSGDPEPERESSSETAGAGICRAWEFREELHKSCWCPAGLMKRKRPYMTPYDPNLYT